MGECYTNQNKLLLKNLVDCGHRRLQGTPCIGREPYMSHHTTKDFSSVRERREREIDSDRFFFFFWVILLYDFIFILSQTVKVILRGRHQSKSDGYTVGIEACILLFTSSREWSSILGSSEIV